MNKLQLTIKLIEEMPIYFSYEAIREELKSRTSMENSTLQTYLSREIAAKRLSDAGKGWYSKIKQKFILDTKPLGQVFEILNQAFPLLEFSCWSTEQINSFTHHMLGKHILFVYVDTDAINSVHEILLDNGYNSYANPGKSEIEKIFRIAEKTVIIRPSVAKQPKSMNDVSPIEKILVDLFFENRKLNIMSPSEVELVIENALKSGTINLSSMLSYISRREMDIEAIIKDIRIIKKSGDV